MRSRPRSERAALALLLAAGCASAPPLSPAPPPPPAVLASRTLDVDEIDAIAAILRAEDEREFGFANFEAWLQHESPEVRRRAALAAGRIGDGAAVPLLLAALPDPEPAVGADAAYALGLLADTSAAVVFALSSPIGAAWSADDDRSAEAARALGSIGGPAAAASLRQILERYQPGAGADLARPPARPGVPAAARAALLATARLPKEAAPIDAILPYLGTGDPDVKWRAAYSLARLGIADAVAPLIGLLGDSTHLVRETAARLLSAPRADTAGMRDAARGALIAALDDAHPHVRINAVTALGSYDAAEAAAALAARLSADTEPHVRLAAAAALASFPRPAAHGALAAAAANEREAFAIRAAALDALMRLDEPAALEQARLWTRAADARLRRHGLRAMTDANVPTDTLFDRLSRDPDAEVAAVAIGAIAAAEPMTLPYARLLGLLAEPDARLRAAAIDAIGARATPAELPILLDAYERASRDDDPVAAIAAVRALDALAGSGMPVARAFFLRFPEPAGTEVHREVARRFGTGGWGEPAPVAPTVVDYERVVRELIAPAVAGEPLPTVDLVTPDGAITLELAASDAPLAVHNFLSLIESGFYPGGPPAPAAAWHRVVPNFVVQDGASAGGGGPGHSIRDEPSRRRFGRAAVGMASRGRDTAGSQFFITHSPQPHLDGGYTVFARVIAGMEIADRALPDDPIAAFVRGAARTAR